MGVRPRLQAALAPTLPCGKPVFPVPRAEESLTSGSLLQHYPRSELEKQPACQPFTHCNERLKTRECSDVGSSLSQHQLIRGESPLTLFYHVSW